MKSARAIPWTNAPVCPVDPPPFTLDQMFTWPVMPTRSRGSKSLRRSESRSMYDVIGMLLTVKEGEEGGRQGERETWQVAFLRRPVAPTRKKGGNEEGADVTAAPAPTTAPEEEEGEDDDEPNTAKERGTRGGATLEKRRGGKEDRERNIFILLRTNERMGSRRLGEGREAKGETSRKEGVVESSGA